MQAGDWPDPCYLRGKPRDVSESYMPISIKFAILVKHDAWSMIHVSWHAVHYVSKLSLSYARAVRGRLPLECDLVSTFLWVLSRRSLFSSWNIQMDSKALFLYISLPSPHDYDVKMPNFTFYRGRKQETTKFSFSFLTWIRFLGIQLLGEFAYIDKRS